jgi:hypothetical protein
MAQAFHVQYKFAYVQLFQNNETKPKKGTPLLRYDEFWTFKMDDNEMRMNLFSHVTKLFFCACVSLFCFLIVTYMSIDGLWKHYITDSPQNSALSQNSAYD